MVNCAKPDAISNPHSLSPCSDPLVRSCLFPAIGQVLLKRLALDRISRLDSARMMDDRSACGIIILLLKYETVIFLEVPSS